MIRSESLLLAISKASALLISAADPDLVINEVLTQIGSTNDAARACVARIDWTPDDDVLFGYQEIVFEWTQPHIPRQSEGQLARFAMLRTDATWNRLFPILLRDGRFKPLMDQCDEPFRSEQMALGVVWGLCCPIMRGGNVWGMLGLDFVCDQYSFRESDLDALHALAAMIGEAYTRADAQRQLLAAERRRADENERLANLLSLVVRSSRALLDAKDFECALRSWLGEIASETDAMRASFHDIVVHDPTGLRTVRTLTEWVREGVPFSFPISFDAPLGVDRRGTEDLMQRMLSGAACALHANECAGPMRAFMLQQGNATTIAIPVFNDSMLSGSLSFDYATRHELSSGEEAILQTAADTLATILKRNEAVQAAIDEREARIVAESRRFAELVRANEALRTSLDAMAVASSGEGFLSQALLEIATEASAAAVYLFEASADDALLRVSVTNVRGTFCRPRNASDPAWFSAGFALDPCFLAQIVPRGRLWHGSETVEAADPVTPAVIAWREALGFRAHSVHALMVGARMCGMVCMLYETDGVLESSRLELVHALCQPLTLALEMARLARAASIGAERAATLAERERIAGEIHDSLAQSFTSIVMQSESLAESFRDNPIHSRILRLIEQTARQGLAEARASVLALQPTDATSGGLDRALTQLAERCCIPDRLECDFATIGEPAHIDAARHDAMLRIAQEAASNAMRHSRGTRLQVRLEYTARTVRLSVTDNGVGLPDHVESGPRRGLGIVGMRARAASVGARLVVGHSALGGLVVEVECEHPDANGLRS